MVPSPFTPFDSSPHLSITSDGWAHDWKLVGWMAQFLWALLRWPRGPYSNNYPYLMCDLRSACSHRGTIPTSSLLGYMDPLSPTLLPLLSIAPPPSWTHCPCGSAHPISFWLNATLMQPLYHHSSMSPLLVATPPPLGTALNARYAQNGCFKKAYELLWMQDMHKLANLKGPTNWLTTCLIKIQSQGLQ